MSACPACGHDFFFSTGATIGAPQPEPVRLVDEPMAKGVPPDAAERRRYALLQAAAVMCAGDGDFVDSVDAAEELLAEIERRESE